MPLPVFQPLPLNRARAPLSHPDWFFEIKWDGFRVLLYSDPGGVRLVSRNGNVFKSFPVLCEGLARDWNGRRCVLDGEIVCLDTAGRPQFRDLLFRRAEPQFYASLPPPPFRLLPGGTNQFPGGSCTRWTPAPFHGAPYRQLTIARVAI